MKEQIYYWIEDDKKKMACNGRELHGSGTWHSGGPQLFYLKKMAKECCYPHEHVIKVKIVKVE